MLIVIVSMWLSFKEKVVYFNKMNKRIFKMIYYRSDDIDDLDISDDESHH